MQAASTARPSSGVRMTRHTLRWTTATIIVLVGMSTARAEEDAATTQPIGPLIEGIVLNHFGGGVVSARVRIESLDARADDPPLAEGTTNQTGDISIRLPAGEYETVRVRIQKGGFTDWIHELDMTDEFEDPFIDATMEGAATLTGTVRAQTTGKPVADARIVCTNGGRDLSATSDEKGQFTFKNMFRSSATLRVEAGGFAIQQTSVAIESDENATAVFLKPERVLELTVVTNEGDPASKVLIEAVIEPDHQFLNAITDEKGKATLRGVSSEATKISFRLSGERYVRSRDFSQSIDLTPTTQPAGDDAKPPPLKKTLTVKVAANIKGKVIDAISAEPIVGVRIIAGREVRYDMPMTWTSIDGTYELTNLPPGLNVLTFQPAAHAPQVREAQLDTGQTTTIDVKLTTGQPIAGIVMDGAQDPVSEVRVIADDWKGHVTLGMKTITGDDGQFSFPHAPDGKITFSFVKPGFGPPVQVTLEAGQTDCKVSLASAAAPADPNLERPTRLTDGDTAPDLTMTATDGTTYKLSELRGKYVFLDCWASWCGPCVAEIPNVKRLYKAAKSRPDFILLGISLDRDRKAFKKAVDDFEMSWPQVFGEKSGAEEAFAALDGTAIPYTCLIGPDGKIVAQHLRGPRLVDEVLKHLPTKSASP